MELEVKEKTQIDKAEFKVHHIRNLTKSTYVLRFDRNNMEFVAGQHLSVGLHNDTQAREYSIYSGVTDPFFEILIREVEDGVVSKSLKKVKKGDPLRVTGPMGFFKLEENNIAQKHHLFVATGTGISPFHAYVKSHKNLQYTMIHGVRFADEAYDKDVFDAANYVLCTSRDKKGDFAGRTTAYLKTLKVRENTEVYLCGNCDMIFEAYDILTAKGIPTEKIHTEVYF